MSVPSHGTMTAFATTLIIFGIVGWTTGWLVASGEQTNLGHGPSPNPVVIRESPKPTPSPTPSPSPTRSSPGPCGTAPNAFPMPDLVGQKFMDARRRGRELGVTVNVHFDQPGGGNRPAGTVVGTNPVKDWCVPRGSAISLDVIGPAPRVKVPAVLGLPCKDDAKNRVIDVGLTIDSYPSGEKGRVYRTDPVPGTELAWNAKVKLYCSESESPGTASS